MGYGPLFYSYSSVEWMIDQYTDLLGGVPLEWSWKYPALVTEWFDGLMMNACHGRSGSKLICRSQGGPLGWSRLVKRRRLTFSTC
jgi:hypothetical protein